jgi:large subunit ribosomal protein L13
MKTYSAKPGEVESNWYVIDASQYVLGRLASEVARRLRGKHKPEYTPHVDTGDYVIVINADQVQVTGRKHQQKMYRRHTGHPGGLKETPMWKQLEDHPEWVVRDAVEGMLPKNRLGRQLATKLKVYAGAEHPHQAQQPVWLEL